MSRCRRRVTNEAHPFGLVPLKSPNILSWGCGHAVAPSLAAGLWDFASVVLGAVLFGQTRCS